MHTSNILMVSINFLVDLCKEESATIVHFFFSTMIQPDPKPIIFRVTSNTESFASWLSNPYAHCLTFISSIRVPRGPCCLCLPMSFFVNIFLIFLGRQLFLVTVNLLLLMLLGSIFGCRCSGSWIVKDSGLCLVPSFGSGTISNCCFSLNWCLGLHRHRETSTSYSYSRRMLGFNSLRHFSMLLVT